MGSKNLVTDTEVELAIVNEAFRVFKVGHLQIGR